MTQPSSDVLAWLDRLVGIDTTSHLSNLPLINEVADYLAGLGLKPLVLSHPDGTTTNGTTTNDTTTNGTTTNGTTTNGTKANGTKANGTKANGTKANGTKANLVVTIPDASGGVTGGVLLSGHTDVVPTQGQAWTSHPYRVRTSDGRLYGRGTTDMKGFDAVVLASVGAMLARPLRAPIHIALTYDEEVGCLGAPALVRALQDLDRVPEICFVGEPTSMRMIRGHKSITVVTIEVTGRAAHSSLTTRGVNAIEHAATLINRWNAQCADWANHGPFDAAYPIGYPTGAVTTITGGNGINIIPEMCTLTLEFRTIGAVDPEAVVATLSTWCAEQSREMRLEAGDDPGEVGVRLRVDAMTPGLDTGVDAEAVRLGQALGLDVSDDKVTYGTEAGIFAAAGISTVVCGPGDIARAHAADEYVDASELAECERFVARLIAHQRV